jgi:hypothetical protein
MSEGINDEMKVETRYTMGKNVEKTKVMRISRQPSPVQIVTAAGECRIQKLLVCHDNRRCKMYTWNQIQDCHGITAFKKKALLTIKLD